MHGLGGARLQLTRTDRHLRLSPRGKMSGQFRNGVSLLAETLALGGEQVMRRPLQDALYSRCSGMIETSREPHAAHSKRRIFLTAEKGVDGLSLRDSKRMGVEYRHIGLAQVT